MSNGSVEGHIVRIFPEQQIGKSNKIVKEFWIKVNDDYNKNNYCSFTLRNKNVQLLDQVYLGEPVTVFFNITGRLHRSRLDADLRCFPTLEAWKVQLDEDRNSIDPEELEKDFGIQKMRMCKSIADLNIVEVEYKRFSKDKDFQRKYSSFKEILRLRT